MTSGHTGIAGSGPGGDLRTYVNGLHVLNIKGTGTVQHYPTPTSGIRHEEHSGISMQTHRIYKSFNAQAGTSVSDNLTVPTWCRLYIPHQYYTDSQGVRAEIVICYHPRHASMFRSYEYVLYTSCHTAAQRMYAKIRTVHEETGFGWNYYPISAGVEFYIGDEATNNGGRFIYFKIIGYNGYNYTRSVQINMVGGIPTTATYLDTLCAAPVTSVSITKNGGASLSPT